MRTSARLALAASATFAFATLGAVVPAQAATAHCPEGDKVELDGESSTVATDLADGTQVCIKAGTETATVTVVDGEIVNDQILGGNGNARGISYYVVTCEPNPSLGEYCGEEPPPSEES
jgi:hypothetical protein